MQYYGIDIHKKYSTYTMADEQGNIMNQGKSDKSIEATLEYSLITPPRHLLVKKSFVA
jgi:hypothetical protein